MTISIVTFGFGAGLLLIGLVGGGLELRELKIPQVGRAVRTLAVVFGLLFVLVGVGMEKNGFATLGGEPTPQAIASVDSTRAPQRRADQVHGAADRQNRRVRVDNQTMGDITEFYASHINTNDWEEDVLGADVIKPGASTTITFNDGTDNCRYDLKAVLSNDAEVIRYNVNVCMAETWTISN